MPPTLGGRMARAALLALLLGVTALGLLAAWAFPRQDRLAAERHQRLVPTTGTVTTTEVRKYDERRRGQGRRVWWEVTVWYTFLVEGQSRVGVNASFSERDTEFPAAHEALAFAARYPAGTAVNVWYDRANPSESARDPAYTPVSFLAPWALAVAAGSGLLGLWVAARTLREARARPLLPSERVKGRRLVAGTAALVGLATTALLVAHVVPWGWHLWRQRSLISAPVYLQGNVEMSHRPLAPVVRYSFRPDPTAQPTRFVEGDAWRFGSAEVSSEGEARAAADRLAADYIADQLVVYFDPDEPGFNAVSLEYGPLLSARAAVACAAGLVAALAALWRLRTVIPALENLRPRADPGEGRSSGS